MSADILVAIDLQNIFVRSGSDWASPMFQQARADILSRIASYGDRVVLTRFVAPEQPAGAWVPYYRDWPFALQPQDAPDYQLIDELAGRPTLDEPTFGKWGPALRAAIGAAGSVELIGVATDCCVIATALPMADAGIAVTVPAGACAGSTPENHEKALSLMELYAPLITVQR